MALFCCRYLSSQPFLVGLDYPDMHTAIQMGYFGFMDYAAVHFNSHCQAIKSSHEKLPSGSESKMAVEAAIRDLARSHCGEINDALVESPPTDYRLETASQGLELSIQQSVTIIREAMLARQSDLSPDAQFSSLEGPIRLKCSRIQCSKFAIGFVEQDAYDQHLEAHERPFRCNNPGCFAYVTGYASQQQLRDHFEDVHSESSQSKYLFPAVNRTGGWDIVEACKAGNLDEVKRFHQAGVDLSKTIPKKTMPLSAAVRAGHFQICEYLVNNGVNPYTKAPKASPDSSPVSLTIRQRKFQIMELFLRSNHEATDLPLYIALAISAEFPRGLDLLMPFIQSEEQSVVIDTVFKSLLSIYSPYVGGSYKPKQKYSLDATTIHVWLERVFPNLYHHHNALTNVCGTNLRQDSREYQTTKEAILNAEGSRQRILKGSYYPLISFMFDFLNKDDLQVKDKSGDTPLHLLLDGFKDIFPYTKDSKLCQIYVPLVQRIVRIDDGLSANTPGKNGALPVYTAMEENFALGILETLLPLTKDLNHIDNNGSSLLHHPYSSPSHFQVLLKHDSIDLFIRNKKGQTALSSKIGNCYRDVVDILKCLVQADKRLAWTADENRDGRTPLHYAMENLELKMVDKWIMDRFIKLAEFLLRLPVVENILQAYLACSSLNYPQKVRQFAQDQSLDEALEVMDRIGF